MGSNFTMIREKLEDQKNKEENQRIFLEKVSITLDKTKRMDKITGNIMAFVCSVWVILILYFLVMK